MKLARLAAAAIALSVAMPILSAHADCHTPEGRATVQIKYRQALAAWSMNNPQAYADAKDQLQKDNLAAQRTPVDKRDENQCMVWQKYINLSKK